jgi:serine/threonine protein phosphatase PrpC
VDVRYSGSTCVSVLTFGTKLFIANVGDSRAILIKKNDENSKGFEVTALTRDHKPCDLDEGKRIIEAGGRIDSYRDHKGNKIGPERVWLLNEEIPGLAMSRSFGDAVACRVGVNAIPE